MHNLDIYGYSMDSKPRERVVRNDDIPTETRAFPHLSCAGKPVNYPKVRKSAQQISTQFALSSPTLITIILSALSGWLVGFLLGLAL